MWHKAIWKGHPMRLELTRVGLLAELANHYTTRGAFSHWVWQSLGNLISVEWRPISNDLQWRCLESSYQNTTYVCACVCVSMYVCACVSPRRRVCVCFINLYLHLFLSVLTNFVVIGCLVGLLGVSTLFGSFNAELNLKQFSLV